MRLRIPCRTSLSLLAIVLISSALARKAVGPSVKSTTIPHLPYNLQYFEDSDVVLYEDEIERNVYYSPDAGVTWSKAKGVPEGQMLELSMHPYDNKRAYIMSEDRKHWRTNDQGQTWQEFSTDARPSLFREALQYHASDPDRMMFNAMDCKGIFCEEMVSSPCTDI